MSVDPAIFRVLVEQGASPEMLLAVVEAAAAADELRKEKKRAGNAERQSRFRTKRNASNALPRVTERDAPLIEDHNPPNPQIADAISPPFSQKVVSDWNEGPAKAGAVPSRKLNSTRQTHLKARVRENSEADVLQAIRNVAGSKFHCGENDRGWKANLGWMLKSAENFEKCLELDTPAQQSTSGKSWTPEERAAYLAKLEARTAEPAPKPPPDVPRQSTGPRPLSQIVQRIQDQAA